MNRMPTDHPLCPCGHPLCVQARRWERTKTITYSVLILAFIAVCAGILSMIGATPA